MTSAIAHPAAPARIGAGRGRRRAVISLTPLIDVVFILLVFFMLASSFLEWRSIALDAPTPAGGGSAIEGALLVDLREDELRVAGRPITLDALEARMRRLVESRPGQRVLVRPAPGVPLQRAVAVLDRLTAAGVTAMSLVRTGGS